MARVSEGVSSSYFAPREVVSGPGSSASVGALLRRWQTGGDAVLVVRDAAVAALGIATRLIDGLVAEGFTPSTFDDITTEPTLEMARAVLERARSCGAVAVVGVGG
ncbi:MAG TPA: iron-containing alcohol dehydrogenase, partial [Propionibacteriaceae bacterium]